MKLNVDLFWHRALLLAIINLVIVGLFLLVGVGGRADYSVLYGTLVSVALSVLLEGWFSFKHERRFSPAELVGAGLFGTLACSMVLCLILYACGVIV